MTTVNIGKDRKEVRYRYDGQWYDGQWYDGQWYDGQWYDGQWQTGRWQEGPAVRVSARSGLGRWLCPAWPGARLGLQQAQLAVS
jgi:hypothetical protein